MATAMWNRPDRVNDIINHYTLYYKEKSTAELMHLQITGDDASRPSQQITAFIYNLSKGKSYLFWVTASTYVGEGESSNIIERATGDSNQCPHVTLIEPRDTSIVISLR
jgi:hypothetical protein